MTSIQAIHASAEPAPTQYALCRHLMADGRRCGAAALRDRHYCYWHNRDYQRRCVLRTMFIDRDAMTEEEFLNALDLPSAEDPTSLLVTLNAVMRAVMLGKLNDNRSSRLLRGCRIATDLLRHVKIQTPQDLLEDPAPIRIPGYPRFEVDTGSGIARDFDAELKAHKAVEDARMVADAAAHRDQLIEDYRLAREALRDRREAATIASDALQASEPVAPELGASAPADQALKGRDFSRADQAATNLSSRAKADPSDAREAEACGTPTNHQLSADEEDHRIRMTMRAFLDAHRPPSQQVPLVPFEPVDGQRKPPATDDEAPSPVQSPATGEST